MMRSNELLEAIAVDVGARLTALSSCQVHDGKWDEAELKRWTVSTPAVLIAWLSTTRTETPGEAWTDCSQQLAAYVVTRDQGELSRGAAARNLVDWLLLYIPRARWSFSSASSASSAAGIGPAEDLRAENLYSDTVDKTGVAMWVVTWRQALRLEAAADGTCPPLPSELYASEQDDPHELLHPEAA